MAAGPSFQPSRIAPLKNPGYTHPRGSSLQSLPSLMLDTGDIGPVLPGGDAAVRDRLEALWFSIGQDYETTQHQSDMDDPTSVNNAKTKPPSVLELVDNSLDNEEDLDTISTKLEENREISDIQNNTSDIIPEQNVMIDGVEYSPTDIRLATNLKIGAQLFEDAIDKADADTSGLGKVGGFIDRYFLRYMPIGMVEDLTRRSERKGKELLQAALTMDPDDYRTFVEAYIEELKEEGIFVSENIFALQDGFFEATNAGYDPNAGIMQALALLDIALPVAGIAKRTLRGSKALDKANSTPEVIAAVEGVEVATTTVENAVKKGPIPDPKITKEITPSAFDPQSDALLIIKPRAASRTNRILDDNTIVRQVRELYEGGSFGRIASPEQTVVLANRLIAEAAERIKNPVYNVQGGFDEFSNPVVQIEFGAGETGLPFKTKGNATKAANNAELPGLEVKQVDEDNPKSGYILQYRERINDIDVHDPVQLNQAGVDRVREGLARFFGSKAALEDVDLTSLANMGEAGTSLIRQLATTYEKSIRKLNSNAKNTIRDVFSTLRDGVDASIRDTYSIEDFKVKYQQHHPRGKLPTPNEIEAFYRLNELSDAAWIMRANNVLKKYVKNGYWALTTDEGIHAGKRVDELTEPTKVWSIKHQTFHEVESIDGKVAVWELAQPMSNGATYVSSPKKVSILDHTDVMGFNAGGRRLNEDAKYFVSLLGDDKWGRAIITTFTEQQAKQAVDQLKEIRKSFLTPDISDDELTRVIQANNDWNPGIETAEQFRKLVEDKGWDLENSRILHKGRDEPLQGDEIPNALYAEFDRSEAVYRQLHRYDDVLMEYGGKPVHSRNPVQSIVDEFGSASFHYAHRAYSYNAAAAWAKRALPSGLANTTDVNTKSDFFSIVRNTRIEGNTQLAKRLRHQQGIILRRLGQKGELELKAEGIGRSIQDFVFDMSGMKIKVGGVEDLLMRTAFQSAFGFANISQFFMQSFHAVNVIGISPIQGMKAAWVNPGLRLAMATGNVTAETKALRRLAAVSGEKPEVLEELAEYIRTSGRDIIDGSAVEQGTGPSWGWTGFKGNSYLGSAVADATNKAYVGGKNILKLGLQPFTQGERIARMTAMSTAFFEFRKKFPNKSPLSDEGRQWITAREQSLSFNMSTGARANFQSGIMKVPTQWMSYALRSLEAVAIGREFTKMERARLAFMLVPMFGLTGFGFGSAADYFVEKYGITNKDFYLGMKYGVLDYLTAQITGNEVALGDRFAPIETFVNVYKDIGGEKSPLGMAFGPSGDIFGGIASATFNALGELFSGNGVSLSEDALLIMRQFSGLDNVSKAIGVLNHGQYRGRTGTVTPVDLKPADALTFMLGFTPTEVIEFYDKRQGAYTDAKKFNNFSKQMSKDFDNYLRIAASDPDRASKLLFEITTKISNSGFSLYDQKRILTRLSRVQPNVFYQMQLDLFRRDRSFEARMQDEIFFGD